MPAVRLESQIFSDPRVKYLAKLLDTDEPGALGRLALVYHYCTIQQQSVLSESTLNIIGMHKNFASSLVLSELGETVFAGIRVKGTEGRIEWYAAFVERQRARGKKRWDKENSQVPLAKAASGKPAKAASQVPLAKENSPTATATKIKAYICARSAETSLDSLHLPGATAPDPDIAFKEKNPEAESKQAEARRIAELVIDKLNREVGRRFEVREPTIKLVRMLLAKGYTERDMRLVIVARSDLWKDDPKMCQYLQPSTLFRASKFGEYLDLAKQALGEEAPKQDKPKSEVTQWAN